MFKSLPRCALPLSSTDYRSFRDVDVGDLADGVDGYHDQPRAQQATAPIIGAIVYLPARQERTSHGILAGEAVRVQAAIAHEATHSYQCLFFCIPSGGR